MSDCFAFRFYAPGDDRRRSLVLFFTAKVSLDVISKALKDDVAKNLVPKNVYLMSIGAGKLTRKECMADLTFRNEFDTTVGDIQTQLNCMSADNRGTLSYCDGSRVRGKLSSRILQCGMLELFRKHSGLIVSNHDYHFVKPSGDHCDKFIRASNLLVSSIEVSFLAISLLPHLRTDLRRVYVDTSSIAFLISIAIQLYGTFDDGLPSIESFSSYAVLNEPYDFVEDRSSMVLISATTSGSLAKKVFALAHFSGDQVVTFLHINLPHDQTGIFNVAAAIEGDLTSCKAVDCKHCQRGSKVIRIAGEQFLPDSPKHELLVIKRTDFSSRRQAFYKQFAANGVLGWNTATSESEDAKEHFFIAVDRALELKEKSFDDVLKKSLKRYVSRDLATVIVFGDLGSTALETKVRQYLDQGESSVNWQSHNELDDAALKDSGSVLVLVDAITSGRSLLAVSRKLRCIDPLASITYLVAFSKLPSEESGKQLEKDLCEGGHTLVILNQCPMPRIKSFTKTAWRFERDILDEYSNENPMQTYGFSLPCVLEGRRKLLFDDSNDSQGLFLCDSLEKPLALRLGFAFWSDLKILETRFDNVTQADVYWTIQCVLHDLRNASENYPASINLSGSASIILAG